MPQASVGADLRGLFLGWSVDGSGMLKESLSHDGLHLNPQGYALMAPVVEAAIEKALK